jgi:hypothetical protein
MKIHCWGGLGSQLFALAIAHDLRSQHPNQRISLVLHTSGVTLRKSELDSVADSSYSISQLNDFQPISANKNSSARFSINFLKFLLKKFLIATKFICTGNTDADFKKIRPWTISLRGHYFERKISPSFFDYLLLTLGIEEKNSNPSKFELAVHYRMGDLLHLSEKAFIPAEKIVNQIDLVARGKEKINITVYSDSPSAAKNQLIAAGLKQNFIVREVATIQVIRECIGVDFFIGTNSKVSLWIVNLRRYLGLVNNNYLEGFDSHLFSPATK